VRRGDIKKPIDHTPSLRDIEDVYDIPVSLCHLISLFNSAVLGRNQIRFIVGIDNFYENESDYVRKVDGQWYLPVSYTHLRAHETVLDLVCRLPFENKNT